MGTVTRLFDGLRNAITGQGTGRDARTAATYAASRPLTQQEIHAAYTGSGLMRKIIRIPALDMVREWRCWEMDKDTIELIEAEEKRLQLQQKALQAETLRALGGGAFVLGLPGNPFDPAPNVGKGGLAFVNVVSRWHLSFSRLNDDASSETFGEPLEWTMSLAGGQQLRLHPSRVIPFRADTSASMISPGSLASADAFWGESTVQQVLDAVKDCDTARASFAALMHKARLTRIGIPRLTELVSTAEGEAALGARLSMISLAESMYNATIYDAGDGPDKPAERIDDVAYSFAGAKDILNAYGEFVAAISDIPATRLLGRAPEGMNSSGDSQQKDWVKKVRAMQTLQLAPCLDRLDTFLVPSALGNVPDKIDYDFEPLEAPDEDKQATRFKTVAEALTQISNLGALPEQAFNEAAQNTLVEGEWMPGLGQALDKIPEAERFGLVADPSADPFAALNAVPPQQQKGGDPVSPTSRAAGMNGGPASAANDAMPRPLYVQRKLLNAADLIAWAKAQGFETTLPASDMHVTVLYSRTPVDPMKLGEPLFSEPDGGLVIKAGGPRVVEQFGEGAVVLQFASWALQCRHSDMVQAGGSHDFEEYMPHVTITYSAPTGIDLAAIKPYAGELRFGPELFEPLNLDWKSQIEEA
jgi:phage-related protein (TIGR01555 family)